jgi:hypothetical protein
MSKKTIVIQQHGESSTEANISEIDTNKLGRGSVTWIPQGDVNTGAITITRNGTYKASDTQYYAFSKATVKSTGKAYGKKDGKKYLVKKDGNGYLVYTEVPDKLGVVTLPNKTVYTRGETIDLTGIRVVAQYADGGVYREIGANELIASPPTATSSSITVLWSYIDSEDGEEVFALETAFDITIENES